jgi:non-homologous end joining protein Ku
MAIKTSISFGLVYIPVTLQNVIKNNDIGLTLFTKSITAEYSIKRPARNARKRLSSPILLRVTNMRTANMLYLRMPILTE